MKTFKSFIFFFIISFNTTGQVLFSEYAEGTSYNKYIEIYVMELCIPRLVPVDTPANA